MKATSGTPGTDFEAPFLKLQNILQKQTVRPMKATQREPENVNAQDQLQRDFIRKVENNFQVKTFYGSPYHPDTAAN